MVVIALVRRKTPPTTIHVIGLVHFLYQEVAFPFI